MKIGNWNLSLFNPFKEICNKEKVVGFRLYKDWYHTYEYAIRFNLLKYPHLTVIACYTIGDKYIERFINFRSKSYREYSGTLSFYENRKFVQDIKDGRVECG